MIAERTIEILTEVGLADPVKEPSEPAIGRATATGRCCKGIGIETKIYYCRRANSQPRHQIDGKPSRHHGRTESKGKYHIYFFNPRSACCQ